MAYKLHHYSAPLTLKEEAFWNEIKGIPHFCADSNLAEGLKKYAPDRAEWFCSLDSFLFHDKLFGHFHKPEVRLQDFHEFMQRIEVLPYEYREYFNNKVNIVDYFYVLRDLILLDSDILDQNLQNLIEKDPVRLDNSEIQGILQEIFPALSEEDDVKELVFHGMVEFSPFFLRCLELLDFVGINVTFCVYYHGDFPQEMAFIGELYDILGLGFTEQEVKPCGETVVDGGILTKKIHTIIHSAPFFPDGEENVSYGLAGEVSLNHLRFLKKDAWLVQFLPSLLEMWDEKSGSIKLNKRNLKVCLEQWCFSSKSIREIMNVYLKLEIFFDVDMQFSDFCEIMEHIFQKNHSFLSDKKDTPFHMLSIYASPSEEEVVLLIETIYTLNEVAGILFLNYHSLKELQVSLEYLKLLYDGRDYELFLAEESAIIERLEEHLNQESLSFNSLTSTIKERIQKIRGINEEDEIRSLWNVIGDIYQHREEGKISFFGTTAPQKRKDILSDFFHRTQKEVNPNMEKYRKQVDISSNIQAYFLSMSLLYQGLEEKNFGNQGVKHIRSPKIYQSSYDRVQIMSLFLCPYRYFNSYILQQAPIIHELPLYEKFYENLLIMTVWQQIAGSRETAVDHLLQGADVRCAQYLPFLNQKQRLDGMTRAKFYLNNSILKPGTVVRDFAPSHMEMKFRFGEAFFQGVGDTPPLSCFTQFIKKNYHSLHQIPKKTEKEMVKGFQEAMSSYINSNGTVVRFGDWCEFCTERIYCKKGTPSST